MFEAVQYDTMQRWSNTVDRCGSEVLGVRNFNARALGLKEPKNDMFVSSRGRRQVVNQKTKTLNFLKKSATVALCAIAGGLVLAKLHPVKLLKSITGSIKNFKISAVFSKVKSFFKKTP